MSNTRGHGRRSLFAARLSLVTAILVDILFLRATLLLRAPTLTRAGATGIAPREEAESAIRSLMTVRGSGLAGAWRASLFDHAPDSAR